MLIECPECKLQLSDKAIACPHCGYPMTKPQQKYTRPSKRKRLPNGFGRITEIKSQPLVNRFRVLVQTGRDEYGRPIMKPLKPVAYFETYNEAYATLMEYNKNPYKLDSLITVKELYDRWSTEYFKKLKSKSSMRTVTAAWKYCEQIYGLPATQIRGRHIKACMDSIDSPNIKSRIKSIFNLMFDYALEYELVQRNYARSFNISSDITDELKSNTKNHISFTDEEISILWEHADNMYVSYVLIQCYMGWRPQELGLIELKNVDLKNWNMIGGMKTDAGTDRKVPIHTIIRPLVERAYDKSRKDGSKYLLTADGEMLTYDKYRHKFKNIIAELGLNEEHKAHDCRKQFITMCKRYHVDEYAIKKMVGHVISDITEKVYTDRDPNWINTEIEKIKLGALK